MHSGRGNENLPSGISWEANISIFFEVSTFLHQKSFGYTICTLLSSENWITSAASLHTLWFTSREETGSPKACIIWNDIIPTKTNAEHVEAKRCKADTLSKRLPPPICIKKIHNTWSRIVLWQMKELVEENIQLQRKVASWSLQPPLADINFLES